MLFKIMSRFNTSLKWEGEIECRSSVSDATKLGKAVLAALAAGSNLSGSDLSGSDLSYSDLSGSNLSGSDLSYSDLSGSNLSGSDLSYSDLSGSNLSYSNLRGSNLRGSNLSGSDLSGSNLRGSNLRGSGKIEKLVAKATRGDGYDFLAFKKEDGGLWLIAGCRSFSLAQFRRHVATEYPNTPKAIETTDILDYLEKRFNSL